jgi:type IV secretory pathway ATPase VirB11/archaellum biosynthesis ATPase
MIDAELLNLVMAPGKLDPDTFQKNKSNFAIKANCGVPVFEGSEAVYKGTPELMAAYTGIAAQMGATIIGGCCGTTPAHVRAMRAALDLYLDVQKKIVPKEKPARIKRRK